MLSAPGLFGCKLIEENVFKAFTSGFNAWFRYNFYAIIAWFIYEESMTFVGEGKGLWQNRKVRLPMPEGRENRR